MNIVSLVKLAIDTGQLRFDPSTYKPMLHDIPLKISDIDRNALEEALRLKQYGFSKIYVLSLLTWGPLGKRIQEAQNLLREALALGADEAILIADEHTIDSDSIFVAKALAEMIRRISDVKIVLAGEATVDKFSSQIPARVACELGFSYVGFVRRIEYKDNKVIVERDLEDHVEIVELDLPAVISVTREINTPRLPTLMQIRAAMKKPLNIIKSSDLGLQPFKKTLETNYEGVKVARKNIIIEGKDMSEKVSKLIENLISEGVIIPRR
ncbi:MAG: electron transfer flavoprotein subunit beta/FixA family protein [Desulfurococcaceae archaeon]|nr:electron transfer flavoprotein subunit beta/FixA family protein [Desulfurococcaceae archaeon]